MSGDDIFDRKHIHAISKKYKGVKKNSVDTIQGFYGSVLLPVIGTQYLSHIIASVRKWFRGIVENDLLEIEIVGAKYEAIESDAQHNNKPMLESELRKTTVNFRSEKNGQQINPIIDYRNLTYIDIRYSLLLEQKNAFSGISLEEIKKEVKTSPST